MEGKIVHQVGMPFNYGWRFPEGAADASANFLTPCRGLPEYFLSRV